MRSRFTFALLGGLMVALLGMNASSPADAQDFSIAQKKQVETLIRDYILKNPEIVQEAMVELDRRQKDAENQARLKITADKTSPLYASSNHVVIGNPNGDVTLVEFFDYNCGYCKKGLVDVQKLVGEDKNLRVILKDLPILSPGSVEASKVALALKSQITPAKFWDFHVKLMATRGVVGEAQALAAARDVGADIDRLSKDMRKPELVTAIDESRGLAETLNINGTPSYVLGTELVVGAVGYDELKGRVDSLRRCGKSSCG